MRLPVPARESVARPSFWQRRITTHLRSATATCSTLIGPATELGWFGHNTTRRLTDIALPCARHSCATILTPPVTSCALAAAVIALTGGCRRPRPRAIASALATLFATTGLGWALRRQICGVCWLMINRLVVFAEPGRTGRPAAVQQVGSQRGVVPLGRTCVAPDDPFRSCAFQHRADGDSSRYASFMHLRPLTVAPSRADDSNWWMGPPCYLGGGDTGGGAALRLDRPAFTVGVALLPRPTFAAGRGGGDQRVGAC